MKKLIFTIVILITSIFAKAQVSQGSILLGGSFQISTSSDGNGPNAEKDKTTELRISPSAGYFLADNFAVGLNVGFSSQKFKTGQNYNELTITSFDFGPFARYYIPTSGDKLYFMASTGLWFGSTKTKNTNSTNTTETKGNSISIYISPGLSYFFNDKWALDFQLAGISYTSYDPNTDSNSKDDKLNTFNFSAASFNPSLGFRYFISK